MSINQCMSTFLVKFSFISLGRHMADTVVPVDRFTITVVLHLHGTPVNGKMTIPRKNRDVINAFNCYMTSFYGKGFCYHSQVLTTVPWKGLLLQVNRNTQNVCDEKYTTWQRALLNTDYCLQKIQLIHNLWQVKYICHNIFILYSVQNQNIL